MVVVVVVVVAGTVVGASVLEGTTVVVVARTTATSVVSVTQSGLVPHYAPTTAYPILRAACAWRRSNVRKVSPGI